MTDQRRPSESASVRGCQQSQDASNALPAHLWGHPDVRAALAAADLSALCRTLRRHSGWRQADLASLAGIGQAYWSQLERGTRGMPGAKVADFLRALGTPTQLLPVSDATRGSIPHTTAGLEKSLPPTDRASLSALSAASAATSLQFAELITSSNVDDDELEYLSLQLSRLATAYVHAPLLPLFADLTVTRDRIFDHLRGRQRPAQTRQLYLLAGTACLLLSHASQNIGDEHSALAQLRAAWTLSAQADHTGLRAWTRGTYALFAEWSPRQRNALAFAEEAATLASPGDSRIRIAAITARAAARQGDRRQALAALKAMHIAQEETPTEDELTQLGGILTFPRAKQDYYTGTVYSLLGDHQRAEYHATAALQQYSAGPAEERSYGDEALARTDLITARLAQGDFESAGRLLQRIITLPPELRIRQLSTGIHRVQRILQQPALRSAPAARRLAELTRGYQVSQSTSAVPSVR